CMLWYARVHPPRSFFFFSSRRRHTRLVSDWSSDVCSSDLGRLTGEEHLREQMGDLYGKVNGYDGRPTNGQIALAGVLDGELTKGEADFTAMLAKDLPALNSGLASKKLPKLERESREGWNKRNEDVSRGS